MCAVVLRRRWCERVAEQELGEFALAEGYDGRRAGIDVVRLHLHALAEIHEGLVDLACFCESCTGCFGGASSLGTCSARQQGPSC